LPPIDRTPTVAGLPEILSAAQALSRLAEGDLCVLLGHEINHSNFTHPDREVLWGLLFIQYLLPVIWLSEKIVTRNSFPGTAAQLSAGHHLPAICWDSRITNQEGVCLILYDEKKFQHHDIYKKISS
jgi:hypothetical protein